MNHNSPLGIWLCVHSCCEWSKTLKLIVNELIVRTKKCYLLEDLCPQRWEALNSILDYTSTVGWRVLILFSWVKLLLHLHKHLPFFYIYIPFFKFRHASVQMWNVCDLSNLVHSLRRKSLFQFFLWSRKNVDIPKIPK